MPRISGVEIPSEKKLKVALTYIYGIGRNNVEEILKKANVDKEKRSKDLTDQEISRLQKTLSGVATEGALKKMVNENIKRLKQIESYRGMRHAAGLPSRGQQTRSNARTKRGKRMTVGALKKEAMTKMQQSKNVKEKQEK
jgi:small subunit ribosomal protein S13